ncbi:MAG: hypothetical protein Tsb0010_02530 [Parvularculaceae bacterium]
MTDIEHSSLVLTDDDLRRIVLGEICDTLSAHFHRHTDFATQVSFGDDTPLGAGGLALTRSEADWCLARASALFGLGAAALEAEDIGSIGDCVAAIKARLAGLPEKMDFLTVGAGGDEVACVRPMAEILQDAQALAQLLAHRRRIISFVPANHFFGFVASILLPKLMGLLVADGRGMSALGLRSELQYGDLLVATPTMWRYLSHTILSAPENIVGVSYGERLPSDLEDSLRKINIASIKEVYGATETGLVGWRNSSLEPFCLLPHWRRNETDADEADLIRTTPDGSDSAVAAMDELIWDSDRMFRLRGRRDGAVQVGGFNVHPARIAYLIESHPIVERCRIGVNVQRDGVCRLIAHIQLVEGRDPSEQAMRDIDHWSRKRLRVQERPRLYSFEDKVASA